MNIITIQITFFYEKIKRNKFVPFGTKKGTKRNKFVPKGTKKEQKSFKNNIHYFIYE